MIGEKDSDGTHHESKYWQDSDRPIDAWGHSGPIAGLINIRQTIQAVVKGGANAIISIKGLVETVIQVAKGCGLILHLSASTQIGSHQDSKVVVCTVEEAIKFGADAVSIHVNLGDEDEKMMLKDAELRRPKWLMEWECPF